jgi:gliding motility-associated-like protein
MLPTVAPAPVRVAVQRVPTAACTSLGTSFAPVARMCCSASHPRNSQSPVNPSSDQIAVLNSANGFSTVGHCNIVLAFDAYLGGEFDLGEFEQFDSHSILASHDGGATWIVAASDLMVKNYTSDPQCGTWVRYNVGLNRELYNRANVILAFRFRNRGIRTNQAGTNIMFNAGFNVDNIEVTASTTNPTLTAVRDVTNPCKNQTTTFRNTTNTFVKGINYQWEVSPTTGFTVVSGQANTVVADSLGELALRFTANGNYTVRLRGNTACNVDLAPVTFSINVGNCPPAADFIAYQTTACSTVPTPTSGSVTQVQLTDLSTSFPAITGYSWNIPGATYVGGTSATSQNPIVQFNTAGTKTVGLTVTNAEGNDTESKTAYLDIADCQCQLITGGGGTPTTAFSENFETNTSVALLTAAGWNISAPSPWSFGALASSGTNRWVVNNDYRALQLTVFGTPFQSLNAIPNQPAVVTNGPQSSYFHATHDINAGGLLAHDPVGWAASLSITSGATGPLTFNTPTIDCSNLQNVNLSFIWGNTKTSGTTMRIRNMATDIVIRTEAIGSAPATWQTYNLTAAASSNLLDGISFRIEFSYDPAGADVPDPGPFFSLGLDEIVVAGVTTGGASDPTTFVCPLPSPLCAGQTLSIPFNAAGNWGPGNTFTAQLSNAAGSFATPTAIGTLTLSGNNLTGNSINGTIPSGTPNGTGYRIRVVGSAPSGGTQTNNDNGENIEVQALPALNAIAGPASVCSGGLASTYTVASRPGVSYAWTVTPGTEGTNWTVVGGQGTNNFQIRWLQNGTFTLRMTETNGCGNRQNNYTVNVTGAPQISDITGPNAVCQSATPVNYSVTNNPGTTSRSWTISNGTISAGATTASPTVVWNTATGPGVLTLTETNSCGTATRSFTVYVNNGAPATPSFTGAANACANSTEAYQATPPVGFNYNWTVTGGTILDRVTPSFIIIQWGATGSGTVSLSVSNGCGTANATPLNVTISDAPSVTGFNIAPTSTVCSNTSTLDITPTFSNGGTGIVIERWELNTGTGFATVPGSAGVNTLQVTNINENRTYRIVYSVGGCTDLLSGVNAVITFGNLSAPSCNVPATVAAGQPLTTATVGVPTGATAPFTIVYEPIEGNPEPSFTSSNTTISLPSYTYAAVGTYNYRITITDANNCQVQCTGTAEAVSTGVTDADVDKLDYCDTENVTVTFSTAGVFGPGNQFNLQLRDEFNQVVHSQNNVNTPIVLNLPQLGVTPGDYRVRIAATNPTVETFTPIFAVNGTPAAQFLMFAADNPSVPTTVFTRNETSVAVLADIDNLSTSQGTCAWSIQTDNGVVTCNQCDPSACGIFPIVYSDPNKQVFFTATLTVTDPSGNCTDTEVVTFRINSQVVQLPNVFTPNGDGINDFWGVEASQFREFDLFVYNRAGIEVFSTSSGSNKLWLGKDNNGQDVPEGTYFYRLKGFDLVGREYNKVGNVTLIR